MRARILLYLLLASGAVLAYSSVRQIGWQDLDVHAITHDFIGIRMCGAMVTQGYRAADQLYDFNLQTQVEGPLMWPLSWDGGPLPCDYPPYTALLGAALAPLSAGVSFLIWDAANLLALLLALVLLSPMLPPPHRHWLWLGALAFLPVYNCFIEGQASPTMLLGIVILWRGLRQGGGANWWAGLGLGLLLLKPQFLPIFLLYLLYKRNWRAWGGFSLTAATAYLIATALSGFGWPFPYLKLLSFFAAQRGGRFGFDPAAMFNWRGLLARLELDTTLLFPLVILLTALALVYAWWRSDQQNDQRGANPARVQGEDVAVELFPPYTLELQLAATTIGALLVSYHLYNHDLTMLLFSGAAMLGWAARHGWPAWMTALLLAALFAALGVRNPPPFNLLILLVLIAAFVVLLYLLLQPALMRPAVRKMMT